MQLSIGQLLSHRFLRLTLFVFFIGQSGISANSSPLSFEMCQKKFLGGVTLSEIASTLGEEDKETSEIIKKLENSKSCLEILKVAQLKSNGLLNQRNLVASKVLESFVNFHQAWLTPEDFDSPPVCQSDFQKDVFDPKTPAYHFTRALFQRDRKASMTVVAYGDLRSIRKGENPKVSDKTKVSSERYQQILGLEEPLDLTGEAELIGFLYKKNVSFKNVEPLNWSETNKSWEQSRQKGAFPLYKHLGAGMLGSPSFVLHYAPSSAYSSNLYQADGKSTLPRKLAQGILKNILCLDPLNFKAPAKALEDSTRSGLWNHPITQENRCFNCHYGLDQIAAGLRHVTFLKSKGTCSKDAPQVLVPSNFETSYSKDLWQKESSLSEEDKDKKFSFSYPVGNFQGERFVGFSQLGRIIADNKDFYRCQVQKYFYFLYEQEIESSFKEEMTASYKEHQDGLKLLEDLLRNPPKKESSL